WSGVLRHVLTQPFTGLGPLLVSRLVSLILPTNLNRDHLPLLSMGKTKKYVYLFGNKKADGNGAMKALLGGKGANLAEMTRIGLPVPPGFTITTDVCTYYYQNKKSYPRELDSQVKSGVEFIEKIPGKKFGDLEKPL